MAKVLYQNLWIMKNQIDPAIAIHAIEQANQDYNPIKQEAVAGEYKRDRPHPPEDQILTRLEDIGYDWVYQYTLSLIIWFKDKGGATAYALKTQTAPGLEDAENGDVIAATETMVDGEYAMRPDLNTVKARLPYLLKKIHDLSRKYRTHLISYMKLWYGAKGSFALTPAPREILAEGKLLKMGADGNPDGYFPSSANSGTIFPQAKAFMDGRTDDPGYQYIREFIQTLNALDLNIMNEDPKTFTQEFIDSLIVTYIESNKEFVLRGRRRSPRVYAELDKVSVSDWTRSTGLMETSEVSNFVSRLHFNEKLMAMLEGDPVQDSAMNYFMLMYFMYSSDPHFYVPGYVYKLYDVKDVSDASKQAPNTMCMEVVDGFVSLPGSGVPYTFDLRCMRSSSDKHKAILTSSGKLILVRRGAHTEWLPVKFASAFIAAYAKSKGAPPAYVQVAKGAEMVGWGQWNELSM